MSEWYAYIVECGDNTLYTGTTNSLERRLRQHNGLERGGSKYTRSRRPVKFVYVEKCGDRSAALKREYEIRNLSREEKLSYASQSTLDLPVLDDTQEE
tara:strand:+ start:33898 stop:34191 length:294 start_codon:yes stop_codon:yes gene_type:complete